MGKKVREYFGSTASSFDSIYSGEKSRFAAWLDLLLRRDMIERFVEAMRECGDVRGMEILDVGCGSGRYCIELAKRGASVTGIDAAGEMLSIARRLAGEEGVSRNCSFVEGGFLHLRLDRVFAVTLAVGFFDYTADPISYLRKMRQSTSGRLIATFPRFWTWRAPLRKIRLSLGGCPVYFYTGKRISSLMRESGWANWRVKKIGKLHFVVANAGK
ncbi:MAG: methyltransferase domain-containing protein [bacterium]